MRFLCAFLVVAGAGCTNHGQARLVGDPNALTFDRDVLPITQEKCQRCHVQGGIGPFPLVTYDDLLAHLSTVMQEVSQRYMPPWMPARSTEPCVPLADSWALSQQQIDTIMQWAEAGAREGDPADKPGPPGAHPSLSPVDATLSPGADYTPDFSKSPDDYHCFVLDPQLSAERDVIGLEVTPGSAAEVHHVLIYAANAADLTSADFPCFGSTGISSESQVGSWAPGTTFTRYPAGTGIPIASTQKLVMQVHYNAKNGRFPDRSTLKLQYSPAPVARPAEIIPVADPSLMILPSSPGLAKGTYTLPADRLVYGATPHMHLYGQHITTRVAGTCAVDIPEWQFRWQMMYLFESPVLAKQGSVASVDCTFDNKTEQVLTAGDGSANEECLSYLYLTKP